jgi:hypothetical protein
MRIRKCLGGDALDLSLNMWRHIPRGRSRNSVLGDDPRALGNADALVEVGRMLGAKIERLSDPIWRVTTRVCARTTVALLHHLRRLH